MRLVHGQSLPKVEVSGQLRVVARQRLYPVSFSSGRKGVLT